MKPRFILFLLSSLLVISSEAFALAARSIPVPTRNVRQHEQTMATRRTELLVGKCGRGGALFRKTALSSSSNEALSADNGKSQVTNSMEKFRAFASKNFFLVGMFVAVGLARLAPTLGRNGGILRPELFIGRYGVTFIFLLSGLSLELSQLKDAASNIKLNSLIQLGTFAAWPFLLGLPLVTLIRRYLPLFLPSALLDGILILTCLPTTVNMCVILARTAGGNTASALCNAIISNLIGIVLTPALLFQFFGASIQLPFFDMFLKLCNKVLVPVAIGQALRGTPVKSFYEKHSKRFKRAQELILLSILWNAFCTAICKGLGLSLQHGIALGVLLPSLHAVSLFGLFKFFSLPILGFTRQDAVSAMFCASQKTLAFGLPLIQTIFEGNPNLALYCAPLMFFHPLELIMGSSLIPRLEKCTGKES
eukprot:scaffold3402_cov169-Amphora_coffeaeformis.AAC.22